MTTSAGSLDIATSRKNDLLVSDLRFDGIAVLLSGWLTFGIYADGWAHNHIPQLETFFTPWHGLLYSGFLACAIFLFAVFIRNRRKGYVWQRAMPVGYGASLFGAIVFAIGGVADMIWHILFGIEANIDALLSPTHLMLAAGMVLIATGPLRAMWRRTSERSGHSLVSLLPMLLSITFTLSLITFMAQFDHPFEDSWASITYQPLNTAACCMRPLTFPDPWAPISYSPSTLIFGQTIGITGILLQTAILMGFVLLVVRRWSLPFGSLTLIFTLNIILMSFMQDQFILIPVAFLAGLSADLLIRYLRPSRERVGALRIFAFAVPTILYLLYFLDILLLADGTWWTIHMWMGSAVLAGVTGLFLSYLWVPPVVASS